MDISPSKNSEARPQAVNLLITNGLLLSLAGNGDELVASEPTAVAVRGDRIADIGPTELLQSRYVADKVLDASHHLIMPGLFNAHHHIGDYHARGLGTDKALWGWLGTLMFPVWASIGPEDAYVAALMACLENIRMGNTTIATHYYGMDRAKKENFDRVLQALQEAGLRAVLIRGFYDRKGPLLPPHVVEGKEEVLDHTEQLLKSYHRRGAGRIQVWAGPISLRIVNPDTVVELAELAQRYHSGIHIHVSESERSRQGCIDEYGMGEIEKLAEIGVLNERLVIGHGVWISDREIELLSEAGSHVSYNPVSNMFLADGVAPVPKLVKAGVNLALGTDTASCNNTSDLFETVKFGLCLQKVHTLDAAALSMQQMFKMATLGGARSVGWDGEIGTLEVGKKADIILVGTRKAHVLPLHDPLAAFAYSLRGSDVETVIVDGEVLMENRVVHTLDEEMIYRTIMNGHPR